MNCRMLQPKHRPRHGTVYVLVLGISMMVLTLSLGAVALVRIQMQNCRDDADASDAMAYAQSAIEIGRQIIACDPDWRTHQSNGTWIDKSAIGTGSFSLNVVNPNGTLDNSISDPVILTGTGAKSEARHVVQVMLNATPQPYTCLQAALFAGQNITVSSAVVQHVGILGTNRHVSATSSFIVGVVEAAGTISGGSFVGERTAGVPLRSMPDPIAVFSHYVTNGTPISINIVPKFNGIATIDRRLFSPTNNPFVSGATNPQGIYCIDCGGAQIIIQNSRIVGTLVLLNTGLNSIMQGAMVASPAVSNYPTLIVRGDFRISTSGTLNETGTPNVNFNPLGTPYQGVANSTTTDSYSSKIQGLYFVSGSLTLSNNPVVSGGIVCGGTLTINGSLTLSYDDTFLNNPPPGFYLPPIMTPVSGTWTRVIN
jgi:hypothetical protein